ncbi:MAG: hypothetical protein HN413_15470 [Chloroflexi bacterium]|mgnify:CR=1 FL=1|jgi:hypothetical protein|nr:hypothetical protein [Chloroflexota bacterium]
MEATLNKRIDLTVQSILDNEKLTDGLEDAVAAALIAWGIACTKIVVSRTAGMDDLQAEEAMYPEMRALRRMMRAVTRWVSRYEMLGSELAQKRLQEIAEYAAAVYGAGYQPPSFDQLHKLLENTPTIIDAARTIAELRRLLENRTML